MWVSAWQLSGIAAGRFFVGVSDLCACWPSPHTLLAAPCPTPRSLLKEKEAELHALAQALLREETLTQADIKSLLAGGSSSPELPGSGSGGSGLLPVPTAAAAAAAADGVPAAAGAAAAAASPGLAASVSGSAAAEAVPPAAE